MILVDVWVPSLGRQYDFSLDERAEVSMLIAEMIEMISKKEHCNLLGDAKGLKLCSIGTKEILPGNDTLEEHKIINGHQLVLV